MVKHTNRVPAGGLTIRLTTAVALVASLLQLGAGCQLIPETIDPDAMVGWCGNNQVDPGEQCDDGNDVSHDGCGGDCTIETYCGNGLVEVGEECDDGAFELGDGCNADCGMERGCGNGLLEVGEDCDDDNLRDGDGCTALCLDEVPGAVCGNGNLERGEGCDDGNLVEGDGCSPICTLDSGCGNGVVDASANEMCDDGNTVAGDGCSEVCRVEFVCGNDYCEAENYETCLLCPADCCPDCGDGTLDPGEECDDFNNEDFDGCDRGCGDEDGVPTCGNGIWEAGEACEDGNTVIHDGCSDHCAVEWVCGDQDCDSHVGETCERCQQDCCPNCGNTVRELGLGEECDSDQLGGRTCADFCYDGGFVLCTDWCTFDLSNCEGTGPMCGDGVAECEEECDGADLRGRTCQNMGFTNGSVTCGGNCMLDVNACSGLAWYLSETFEDPADVQTFWTLQGDWEVGEPLGISEEPPAAAEGQLVIGTNVGGDHSNSQPYLNNMAISPSVHLTAATNPVLLFQMWGASYSTDCWNVWATDNGGLDWFVLANPSVGYNDNEGGATCWSGNSVNTYRRWQEIRFDLSPFNGRTLQLGFSFYSNTNSALSGAYIDSVLVTEANMIPVEITSRDILPLALPDDAYGTQLTAIGGTGIYDWSIVGGVNHSWLSIDPVTGLLTGTPTAANLGLVEVQVRCAESTLPANQETNTFSLQVSNPLGTPYIEDFEDLPSMEFTWILTGDWEVGVPTGFSEEPGSAWEGAQILATNLGGDYSHNMAYLDNMAISPPIDLTGLAAPLLSFKFWGACYTSADGMNVWVSTDNGQNWSVLSNPTPAYNDNEGGQQCWTGNNVTTWRAWNEVSFDLTAYIGQSVRFGFAMLSNQSTAYSGMHIDAVSVGEANAVPVFITSPPGISDAGSNFPYAYQLNATGGTGVFDWTINSGTNHGWLSIDPSTGTLTGTPLAGNLGPVQVEVQCTETTLPTNFDTLTVNFDVTQVVYLETFDGPSQPAGWTFLQDFQWGSPTVGPTCYSPPNCIATYLNQNHGDSRDYASCRMDTAGIDLTGYATPSLTFFSWIHANSGFDGGNVKIATNAAGPWTLITPVGGYDTSVGGQQAFSGIFTTWELKTFDISAYGNQTIYLRFGFDSTSSGNNPGWYIDNLTIVN